MKCSRSILYLVYRLREHEAKFFNYFRICVATFDYLLQRLDKHIALQETNMRQAIPPTEMLAVTIRYLVSGMTFTDLHYAYRLGPSTIRKIVRMYAGKFGKSYLMNASHRHQTRCGMNVKQDLLIMPIFQIVSER
ncbi:unnamed protein product [Acanthoscelides obtectus]|uniref:Uncharacterized protein n=1 Tax=Acanthoscelides obtectus TaxID=200917 RepID=A0A9P0VRU7_ACAOB|nr:unnamed protein product [Acanthoscelides obtectus]CAK1688170.1 hypothetical protein AOBTE_LOCUS36578 [Acanthoscelides obtectus]